MANQFIIPLMGFNRWFASEKEENAVRDTDEWYASENFSTQVASSVSTLQPQVPISDYGYYY